MSIEGLILFFVFVIMPLLQQWREKQRRQQSRSQPRRAEAPAGRAPGPGRTGRTTAPPDEDEVEDAWRGWEELEAPAPPPPVPATRVPVRTAPAVERRQQRPARPATPAPVPPRPKVRAPRARPAVTWATQAGLRQAVVQMTVLGPCRANQPYGWD